MNPWDYFTLHSSYNKALFRLVFRNLLKLWSVIQLPLEVRNTRDAVNMATTRLDRIFEDVFAQRTQIAWVNCAVHRQRISRQEISVLHPSRLVLMAPLEEMDTRISNQLISDMFERKKEFRWWLGLVFKDHLSYLNKHHSVRTNFTRTRLSFPENVKCDSH